MGLRAGTLCLGLALLAGCGGDEGGSSASTAPADLLRDQPAGLTYAEPSAATVERYRKLLETAEGDFSDDDLAIRDVERDGRMVAQAIVIDGSSSPEGDIARGFAEGFSDQTGKKTEKLTLAGVEVTYGENAGRAAAVAEENDLGLEVIGDPPVVKRVLEHLIREAEAAG
jgi:hypothetical protein